MLFEDNGYTDHLAPLTSIILISLVLHFRHCLFVRISTRLLSDNVISIQHHLKFIQSSAHTSLFRTTSTPWTVRSSATTMPPMTDAPSSNPTVNNDNVVSPMHNRIDSRELGGVGAQFRRSSKADSIARPSDIDIDIDVEEGVQIRQHSIAGNITHEPRHVSYGNGPGCGSHKYSKEDVALLISHRDRAHDAETGGGMYLCHPNPCVSASQV
jgi:hypothetical protein